MRHRKLGKRFPDTIFLGKFGARTRKAISMIWWPLFAAACIFELGMLLQAFLNPTHILDGKSLGLSLLVTPLYLGAAFAPLLAGYLIYRHRSRAPIAVLLSTGFLVTAVGLSGIVALQSLERWQAHTWGVLNVGFTLLMISFLGFPDGQFRPRWTAYLAGALAITALLAQLDFRWSGSTGLAVFWLLIMFICPLALYLRFDLYPADSIQRQQLKYALWGVCASAAFLGLFVQFIASADYTLESVTPGVLAAAVVLVSLTVFAFTTGLLVAMLRFRLYAAEAIITRSAAVGIFTVILTLVFAVVSQTLEGLLPNLTEDAGRGWSNTLAALVVILLINPAQKLAQRWARSRFQTEVVRLAEDWPARLQREQHFVPLNELLH